MVVGGSFASMMFLGSSEGGCFHLFFGDRCGRGRFLGSSEGGCFRLFFGDPGGRGRFICIGGGNLF